MPTSAAFSTCSDVPPSTSQGAPGAMEQAGPTSLHRLDGVRPGGLIGGDHAEPSSGQQRGEHGGALSRQSDRRECFVQARIDEHEMPRPAVLDDDRDVASSVGRDGVAPTDTRQPLRPHSEVGHRSPSRAVLGRPDDPTRARCAGISVAVSPAGAPAGEEITGEPRSVRSTAGPGHGVRAGTSPDGAGSSSVRRGVPPVIPRPSERRAARATASPRVERKADNRGLPSSRSSRTRSCVSNSFTFPRVGVAIPAAVFFTSSSADRWQGSSAFPTPRRCRWAVSSAPPSWRAPG